MGHVQRSCAVPGLQLQGAAQGNETGGVCDVHPQAHPPVRQELGREAVINVARAGIVNGEDHLACQVRPPGSIGIRGCRTKLQCTSLLLQGGAAVSWDFLGLLGLSVRQQWWGSCRERHNRDCQQGLCWQHSAACNVCA